MKVKVKRHVGLSSEWTEIFDGVDEDFWESDVCDELWKRADKLDGGEGIYIARDIALLFDGLDSSSVEYAMAHDPDVLTWMIDFWAWNNWVWHGNTPTISEVGFFGLCNNILTDDYEDVNGPIYEPEYGRDSTEYDLHVRRMRLKKRYAVVSNHSRKGLFRGLRR